MRSAGLHDDGRHGMHLHGASGTSEAQGSAGLAPTDGRFPGVGLTTGS